MNNAQSLSMLTAMNQRQQEQFTQATILAIGVVMKKVGITEISVGAEDFEALQLGEKVRVTPNIGGGFTYSLAQPQPAADQEPSWTTNVSPASARVLVALAEEDAPLTFGELKQLGNPKLNNKRLEQLVDAGLIERLELRDGYRWMLTGFGRRHVDAAKETLQQQP